MTNELELEAGESLLPKVDVSLGQSPNKQSAGPTMLDRLLAMAQRYRQDGNTRQATEMFWGLVDDHDETPQAQVAKAELTKLAEAYERAGNQRMARSMYERLMDLED